MSIKIILASIAAILAGIAFLYLFIKGEPKPKEKKPAEQPAAKKVEPPKKTSPQPQKVEPPKKAEPAKPKPAAKPTPSLTDEETISMDKVDHFSEYSAYKQFGYYDQAADSLAKHLETQKMPPHDLVIELCGMYIECGDIDGCRGALRRASLDTDNAIRGHAPKRPAAERPRSRKLVRIFGHGFGQRFFRRP